ncbi:enolase [Hyaloscypha variabilis F]|uniref:Enolase n=1 Tax=Hyaloscypha variabilis (strain UAMH 11265 / GT02V1 / F) TaxID=1149755 RepID=A0A2J6R4F2_HYAVF|nr:enolase [Hyaloscypha variabilis F]
MPSHITSITAAQRLDSRGNPTVQVRLTTNKGTFTGLVPSGASTGIHEALELRDTSSTAYGGKGVKQAVHNVTSIIAPALIEKKFDVETQLKEIDAFMCELDGTKGKKKLGANAILGVSMACARAGAAGLKIPLYEHLRLEAGALKAPYIMPVPFFNVLNGGVHSGNTMAFQEIMLAPTGATSITEAVQMGAETYHALKTVITKKFGPAATGIGDEGGFAPPISKPSEALDLLVEAVEKAGYTGKIQFAMDPASSEFFREGQYDLGIKDKTSPKLTPAGLSDLYRELFTKYPIVLLEDPFAEDDWETWSAFMAKGKEVKDMPEIVGDDLTVTNVERVREAQQKKACNGLLLKINQIGTVSEAIAAANLAFSHSWGVFVSHRSGETTDDFIADLTVGLRTGHLKTGAPARGERVVKYNRLMDIEDELKASGEDVVYAGTEFRTAHSAGGKEEGTKVPFNVFGY